MYARMLKFMTVLSAIALVAACTSKNQLSQQEIKKIFPDKPSGLFKPYSAKEMKAMKLKSSDFSADVSAPSAIDSRLSSNMSEQHHKKYLLTSGVFEWNERVSLRELTKKSVSLLHKGQLINYEKGADVSKVRNCKEETLQLSSGVIQRELKCEALDVTGEAEKIGAEVTSCAIQTIGTHPIKTNSIFGRMTLKNDKRLYLRVTKETRVISGEIICDGDNMGMGSETRITYYSNEEPNVSYPAVGSHKILFQSRSIVKSSGAIVYKSSDEITEVTSPQMQAASGVIKKSIKAYPKKKNVRVANKKRSKRVALK